MKKHYYSLKKILSYNADYNLIIGERSNGKTYSVLKYCIEQYKKNGDKFVYLRRWKEDIIGKRGDTIFNSLIQNNEIKKITENSFSNCVLQSGKFYFSNYDDKLKKQIPDADFFCYLLSLSDMEHDKSLSFSGVKNIVFDEFLTRRYYLKDEFMLLMNVLSTIIRDRKDIKIFMLGNTVNKFCPYFIELGINIDNLKQGNIDLYHYGNSELTLAIEYCDTGIKQKKESNKYFAFNNPRLNMIKNGQWELDIYPHLPIGYKIEKNDIIFSFYVLFGDKIIQGDIIQKNTDIFIFYHYKTTEIKDTENSLIYSLNNNVKLNYRKNIIRGIGKLENKINYLVAMNKVFYQNNEIGELIHNYNLQANN